MKGGVCLSAILSVGLLFTAGQVSGQSDPGPRTGDAGAGPSYNNLDANEKAIFEAGLEDFMEVDSVSGNLPGEDGAGLGPTFNGNSCAQCHAQPAVGGSSPGLKSPQIPTANPQVGLATLDGATNTVPAFITSEGPVREARFVRNPDGSPDGGVHGLYTIKGRSDAPGCNLGQPDFAGALARHNVIFRIPTPTYGLGLVEATPDSALQDNLSSNRLAKALMGIRGRFNTSGNDGSITRFGWKAQNKSLLVFAGEAYNVEQGVSNEAFANERSAVKGCVFNGSPEDGTKLVNDNGQNTGTAGEMSSDLVTFAAFMRLLAPPSPAPLTPSAQNGATLFNNVGCALCHSPSLTTGTAHSASLSQVQYHPYSDFALHHMGSGLSDGVSQGAAGPDEFRSAPLWGLGQRLFFLHDGRTSDLNSAIQAHAGRGSEANTVVGRFNRLSRSQRQSVLDFLRSL
jgi:CxxC motif-containing protein (DUF1111 family)